MKGTAGVLTKLLMFIFYKTEIVYLNTLHIHGVDGVIFWLSAAKGHVGMELCNCAVTRGG